MGKDTGFLEYQRNENTNIPVLQRIRNFEEFKTSPNEEERKRQAARCMNCGVPMCQSALKLKGMVTGCPLHNFIPEWNDQIYKGNLEFAASRLLKTSNFPEFTGRVCPALCEKACMCGQYGDPVTVHDNEKYLIEAAFANGDVKPQIPALRSGKKVAVVGSGPAGLAVADQLNKRGHSVTVYEREDRIGGLLMYGIPNMKLDKSVIKRRQELMEKEGLIFKTNVNVGVDITAEELKQEYDAVVLSCGAKRPRPLAGVDPKEVKGVHYAVDFLTVNTKSLLESDDLSVEALERRGGYINAKGKDVIVIGGGDTGNDCIGTVIRQGCKSVTALEMMPASPEVRAESNPWPEWPLVKKTDYGHEEAIEVFGHDPRVFETTIKEIHTDKRGALRAVTTVKVSFANGKMEEVAGTEKKLPCKLLLIAAGFIGCEPYTAQAFETKCTQRGTIETEEGSYRTSVDKVFTAGDMHRGQSLVVWAIAEGRECAKQVDEYLMGYTTM